MLPQPGSWKNAHLRFFHTPLVSLTPCFSWVLPADPVGVNRFNGFEGADFWTCAGLQIRFSYRPFVSLTPCFSWVLPADPAGPNRFNGFAGADFWTCARPQIRIGAPKPLKRLKVAPSLLNTQLKQGVNEMGRGRKKSEMR